MPWYRHFAVVVLVAAVLPAASVFGTGPHNAKVQALSAAAGLPVYFEAEDGQAGQPAGFVAKGRNCNVFLDSAEAVFLLGKSATIPNPTPGLKAASSRTVFSDMRAVTIRLPGANPNARMVGLGELPGKVNYLIGSDPSAWRTGMPLFSRVQVKEIYPGIDLVYYCGQQQLEYDFTIAPHADPNVISLHVEGADQLQVDAQGDLVLKVGDAEIRQHKPVIYQEVQGTMKPVVGGYRLLDKHTAGFWVADYNHNLPLVIDPELGFSSFLGGSALDVAWSVALDPTGDIYVAGETVSSDLRRAATNSTAYQTNYAGGTIAGRGDAFVAKFDNTNALIYLTYLGGSGDDGALGLAVDSLGNAYITGYTGSTNFPKANLSLIQPAISGVADPVYNIYPVDAFVAKLGPAGTNLLDSTYLGGGYVDEGVGVALDALTNVYVVGLTESTNFPVTNAVQNYLGSTTNGQWQYLTYVGVTNLYLGATANAFVTKIKSDWSALQYSTYLGGSNIDYGEGISADAAGNACVVGFTTSPNFLTTTNTLLQYSGNQTNFVLGQTTYDGFVTMFDPTGTNLLYSTYLGGSGNEIAYGVVLNTNDDAYVVGMSASTNFYVTTTTNNLPSKVSPFATNVFVTVIATNGLVTLNTTNGPVIVTNSPAIKYSTVFGGDGVDIGYSIAMDASGNTFVIGSTTSATDFPTTNVFNSNAGGSDAFITALNTNLTTFLYSFYFGGSQNDYGYSIAVDSGDNVYIVGGTSSTDFRTYSAFQSQYGGGASDAFITKISIFPPTLTAKLSDTNVRTELEPF